MIRARKWPFFLAFLLNIWYYFNCHGGLGEVVNTPDCGSGMQGFDSLSPPHIEFYAHLCAKDK